MIRWTLAAAVLTLAACQAKNTDLTAVPKPAPPAIARTTIEQVGDGLEVKVDTRVDILFVIDDSKSMKNHQENLSRNIHRFVDAIAKIQSIDFHIGYTVAHDFSRYGVPGEVPQVCGANTAAAGRVNFEEPGTLKQLEGPADKLPKDGRRFVTRDDDFKTLLAATLDPNTPNRKVDLVKPYIAADAAKPEVCPYGPEEEALFSPLLGAVEDQSRAITTNKGFRRPGAFFVAIIVSDAKDASLHVNGTPVTPEEVVSRLSKATGEQRLNKKQFRVFAVAMKPGTTIRSSCKPDPAWARVETRNDGQKLYYQRYGQRIGDHENPLANLAALTEDGSIAAGGQTLSICDGDYGDVLAKYGAQVQKDALKDIMIELPAIPQRFAAADKRNLNVLLGEMPLDKSLWSYNMQDNTVTVFGQKMESLWNQHPGAKIRVRYVPVDASAGTTKFLNSQQK